MAKNGSEGIGDASGEWNGGKTSSVNAANSIQKHISSLYLPLSLSSHCFLIVYSQKDADSAAQAHCTVNYCI